MEENDYKLITKYNKETLTLFVALHELLGHGTGKEFTKDVKTGKLNFPEGFKNPFTGKEVDTYYLSTESC